MLAAFLEREIYLTLLKDVRVEYASLISIGERGQEGEIIMKFLNAIGDRCEAARR